jgi:hypothetical protein
MEFNYSERLSYMQTLRRLMSSEVLKDNLAKAGLYLIAWDLLQDAIVGNLRRFFSPIMPGDPDDDYKKEVLSLHPDPKAKFIASCRWFQNEGVLSDADVTEILQIRKHRTDIAHEMPNVLLNPQTQIDEAKLMRISELLSKIDRWWITMMEVPLHEEFDGQQVRPEEVKSGKMEFLDLLISAVYYTGTV